MSRNQQAAVSQAKIPVIVLTGGGSGGHITPLLSLAHELKRLEPGCNIVYIGHKGDKFDRLQEHYHDFDFTAFINAGKFRRYHGESLLKHLLDFRTVFLNIRDFFRLVPSIFAALRILNKVKPKLVFSKGSFVALPVGIAAKLKRIPIVTHDSDVVPGLANKILGRWAVANTTGMPAKLYNYPKSRLHYVGIPIDERIKLITPSLQRQLKERTGVKNNNQLLLIAGGGHGARDINEKVIAMAPDLLSSNKSLQVVHIAGQKNEQEVKQLYRIRLKEDFRKRILVLGFTEDFYEYSGAADLIISRAGATTIAEYAAAGKACLLIPSPFLAGGHQLKNAESLKKLGAVEVIDNDATAQVLLDKTLDLLKDNLKRQRLAKNLNTAANKDAASKLAKILLEVTKDK